jgi:hypothetical protein
MHHSIQYVLYEWTYSQSIKLSPSLNALQEPVKQELRKVFAIHSNVRTKYAIAALLYDEAKRVAQSYEQRRNDALAELNDLTVRVDRCVYLALNGEPSSSKEFEEHGAILRLSAVRCTLTPKSSSGTECRKFR